uniref:DDE Tnp4 domain-containing protein n=1 Tax=Sander lucioperca TaxID=283035 RepID=A0A8C9X376_SANLU
NQGSQRHHQYFRMSAEKMDELLSIIGPDLTRQNTRSAIEPKQRLAVGLRILLAVAKRKKTIGAAYTVEERVCAAIEKVMMHNVLARPTTDSWNEVAQRFWDKWNFPNCLRALDGKHIVIQATPLSGSQYFNYKKTLSIVCIQVGDFGRTSDGGVYAGSDSGREMENNTLGVPPSTSLPGAAHLGDVQHVMVGDAAFPLKPHLMRPYPGQNLIHRKRIFNYRPSRARMVVENAFGIWASRWRIFHRRINLHPKHVDTLAACILHNFLPTPSENVWLLEEAEELGRHMAPVRNMGGNRESREACAVRESFATFFTSPEGSVLAGQNGVKILVIAVD